MSNRIYLGDNLRVLSDIDDGSVDLIYIDPPFNTGKPRVRKSVKVTRDCSGCRVGFGGNKYRVNVVAETSWEDRYGSFIDFIYPRLEEAYRVLSPHGSLFFHIDYREAHYCKVVLDTIFGRRSFMNEIIWAYDFGGRSKTKWPAKHDTIFWYAKNPSEYVFNYEAMDRIPYMAPGLVGRDKAARGKTPTDVWWHTIVGTSSKEKTTYPTQKPLGIMHRIVRVHSNEGDHLLDFFAGSGSFGEAAALNNRSFTLVDNNKSAFEVMKERFKPYDVEFIVYHHDTEE